MSFWPYLLLAAVGRAAFWIFGEDVGYVVGTLIIVGVALYWARRGYLALKARKQARNVQPVD